jgi:hypothetical protein
MGGRHLPSGIIVDGGSDWVALHRGFCQYLHNDAQSELLVGLRTVFNHTLLPAEVCPVCLTHVIPSSIQNLEFLSFFL